MAFMFRDLMTIHAPISVENHLITIASAGTELPIISIGYDTGTITLVSGSAEVEGAGTSFIGNISAGDKLETAGGTIYIVHSVNADDSLTLLEPASSSESGVTFKSYTANRSVRVVLKAFSTNTSNVYIGRKGVTSSTGLELKAGAQVELILDNRNINLYVDAGANNQKLSVLLEKGGTMQIFVPTNISYNHNVKTGGAGSKQLISSKVSTVSVTISALSANASSVYIGDSLVSNSNGLELAPGETITLYVNDNIADIYFYAADNEGVSYLLTRK